LFSGRTLGSVAILLLVASLSVYAVVILTDYRLPMVNLPEQTNTEVLDFSWHRNNSSANPDVVMQIFAEHNGTIVDHKPVFMFGAGYMNITTTKDIANFTVGIQHGTAYPKHQIAFNKYNMTQGASITMFNVNASLVKGTVALAGTSELIIFLASGDFNPFMQVHFKNGQSLLLFSRDTSLHVAPSTELTTERFARVNYGLSVVLVMISILEGVKIAMEIRRGR